jgi:hypothetical protein
VGRVVVDRAVCDRVSALVVVLEERRNGTRRKGKVDRKGDVLSNSFNALLLASS